MTRWPLALMSALAVLGCAPKKKKQKPPTPTNLVVKPDPATMEAPTPQLVRDIGRGEIGMGAVVDVDKGLFYAYYNADLGSERRLCGDALRASVPLVKGLIAKLDREGYQLQCDGMTCIGVKGTQWRGAVSFRSAGGLKLDGVMVYMHPDAGDVFDNRLDAAREQVCGPTIHALLDRSDAGFCQTLCARAEGCQSLKPIKANAAKCQEQCGKNKDAYSVGYCDVAGKDCATLTACVAAHKDLVP